MTVRELKEKLKLADDDQVVYFEHQYQGAPDPDEGTFMIDRLIERHGGVILVSDD